MTFETSKIDERYKSGRYNVSCYIDDIAKLYVYCCRIILNQREFIVTGEKKYLKSYMKYKGLFFKLIKKLYGDDIIEHYEEWSNKISEDENEN